MSELVLGEMVVIRFSQGTGGVPPRTPGVGEGEAMGEAADLSKAPKGEAVHPVQPSGHGHREPPCFSIVCSSWGAGCLRPSGSPQTFSQGVSFMEP